MHTDVDLSPTPQSARLRMPLPTHLPGCRAVSKTPRQCIVFENDIAQRLHVVCRTAMGRLDLDPLLPGYRLSAHISCGILPQGRYLCVRSCISFYSFYCIVEAMLQPFVWSVCFFLTALLIPQPSFAVTVKQLGTPQLMRELCSAILRFRHQRLITDSHSSQQSTPNGRHETSTLRRNCPDRGLERLDRRRDCRDGLCRPRCCPR